MLTIDDLTVRYWTLSGESGTSSFAVRQRARHSLVGVRLRQEHVAGRDGSLPAEPSDQWTGFARARRRLAMTPAARRHLRGTRVSLVFQDHSRSEPIAAYRNQVGESSPPSGLYGDGSGLARSIARRVGIKPPLSRNRIMAFRRHAPASPHGALTVEPELVIPVNPAALDVTIEAQILNLLEGCGKAVA